MHPINATNPIIVKIVRKINKVYPHVDLADIVVSALDKNNDALDFLSNEPLLRRNAQIFLARSTTDDKDLTYRKYLHSLEQAQIHLNREGREYDQLKLSLAMNFRQSRHKAVLQYIRKIADELYYAVDAKAETQFLNYLTDRFTEISIARQEGRRIIIGNLEPELTSGEHGFILTWEQPDEIIDLFFEAAVHQRNLKERKSA